MTETSALRRRLAVVVLCAICVAAVPWRLLEFVWRNGSNLSEVLASSIDRRMPGFSDFASEVRARTKPGEKIAIAVPANDWEGYAFAYYRASYLLSGRVVLPLIDPLSRPVAKNWHDAQVIAIYQLPPPESEPAPVWQGKGGAIIRR